MGLLATTDPFASYKDKIAYHSASSSDLLGCGNIGDSRAVVCDWAKVESFMASKGMPADKVITIINSNAYGGGANTVGGKYSTYNIGSDNYGAPEGAIAIHEFGHQMGLQDEYVYAEADPKYASQYEAQYADPVKWPKDRLYGQCSGQPIPRDAGAPPPGTFGDQVSYYKVAWKNTPGPWSVFNDLTDVEWWAGCASGSWFRPSKGSIMKSHFAFNYFNSPSIRVMQQTINSYLN